MHRLFFACVEQELFVLQSKLRLVLLIPCTAAFSFGINGCETQLRSRGDASTPVHAQHIRMRSRGHGLLALRAGIELPPALMLAASVASAGKTFEAQAPPLGTTIAVLGSTAGVLAYWWLVLVPSDRRDLAKNKNKVRNACPAQYAAFTAFSLHFWSRCVNS